LDGEQHLAGQSFVAVAADGMDPCDLRLASGDGALRDLVARRTPLFEFAIRSALAEIDLDSAEGRVAALRRCVPMVAQIKDPTLRDEYARQLAGWVGWDDVAQVISRVREDAKTAKNPSRAKPRRPAGTPSENNAGIAGNAPVAAALRPDPRDPTLWPQREALKSALQYPALAGPVFDALTVESFTHPGYAAVRAAIAAAGGAAAGITGGQWMDAVRRQAASPAAAGLVGELSVEMIRVDYHALFGDLVAMEAYRRSLLEQASGDDLTV
jgi:DNA primase